MAAHQASHPPSICPCPTAVVFLSFFHWLPWKVAEEWQKKRRQVRASVVCASVRACVRVRCITHATRCEAAIYGQWLQMNKAANSFDKLHCRLFIIELRAWLAERQRTGGGGKRWPGDKAACDRNATVIISQRSIQVATWR